MLSNIKIFDNFDKIEIFKNLDHEDFQVFFF